jgi:membrane fusion protein (multidrug efflux system)
MAAQARLHAAELDLSHTRLTAPATAVVTQVDSLQKGQYVTSGTTVLTLVRSGSTRIEANYKETNLTNMRVGQPARVTVDAYPDVKLKGTVESIGAGTGSAFALIPAQNATGNWVKVVQRLPVRIALKDARTLRSLRVGMSVTATVGTGHSRGLPSFISGVLETLGLSGQFDGPANGPSGAKR